MKNKFQLRECVMACIKALQLLSLFVWTIILKDTNAYYSVYVLCALVGTFCFFDNTKSDRTLSKKKNLVVTIAAGIFSMLVVIANYDVYLPLNSTNILNIPFSLLGGLFVGKNILKWACDVFPLKADCEVIAKQRKHPLRFFFITFGIIVAVDLVYLLLYTYPGVVSVDSINQLTQVFTDNYSNHHPFWHTINLKIIIEIGLALFGNINAAVALYSVCTVLFMAGAFAYAMVTLYEAGVPKKALMIIYAVFAFMPYNVAYSVNMWKDVGFAGVSLFLVVTLYRIFKNIGKYSFINYAMLVCSGLAFSLWRSNGKLAFLAALVIFVLVLRKKHVKLTAIMAVVFVVCTLLQGPLLAAVDIKQTQYCERLSIPMQQIARVITAGCELTQEEEEQLSKIMDVEKIPTLYKEYISDPVKDNVTRVGDKYIQENKLECLKLWVKLGLKYPQYYAAAFVEQTKGYWNGGYDYLVYSTIVTENELGITEAKDSRIATMAANMYFWAFDKQEFAQPLSSIGLHVWILAAVFVVTFLQRRRAEMLITLPILFMVATLVIATPVFCEFRYSYGVFTTLPFILGVTLFNIRKNTIPETEKIQEVTENE